jgi:penicillin-binding protein 1A
VAGCALQGRAQGASTLTMQLARNLFLSSEKTYGRKVQEIFLSLQIERHFTKQQIFALYANQIYLGVGRMDSRRARSITSANMCAI